MILKFINSIIAPLLQLIIMDMLGDKFFLANYTSGIRIIDISGISDKEISEIGFFDTYPTNNSTSFNGVWSVYPYFESGIISISDSDSGLFLVKKSD